MRAKRTGGKIAKERRKLETYEPLMVDEKNTDEEYRRDAAAGRSTHMLDYFYLAYGRTYLDMYRAVLEPVSHFSPQLDPDEVLRQFDEAEDKMNRTMKAFLEEKIPFYGRVLMDRLYRDDLDALRSRRLLFAEAGILSDEENDAADNPYRDYWQEASIRLEMEDRILRILEEESPMRRTELLEHFVKYPDRYFAKQALQHMADKGAVLMYHPDGRAKAPLMAALPRD